MLSFLKNHPFAVEAFFEKSLVVTFAVKKEQLKTEQGKNAKTEQELKDQIERERSEVEDIRMKRKYQVKA